MFLTAAISLLVALFLTGALWVFGRVSFVSLQRENATRAEAVKAFRSHLVNYANSGGDDGAALRSMLLASSEVERWLGLDNYPTTLRMGHYLLQGAPVLPMALQEMQRHFGDHIFRDDARQIAVAVDGVLLRHLGRREADAKQLYREAGSVGTCIAYGWARVAALPLSVLRAFGLLSEGSSARARSSLVFKLWSLALALLLGVATLAGPVLSYLADREKIDSEVKQLRRGSAPPPRLEHIREVPGTAIPADLKRDTEGARGGK